MSRKKITIRKGIILAGGSGSRLLPHHPGGEQATLADLRQADGLLSAFGPDAGRPAGDFADLHSARYRRLSNASWATAIAIGHFALRYAVQPEPKGLAQAFLIGREFVGDDHVAMILGDNIFYGQGFQASLLEAACRPAGATVFAYAVRDPERYGVIEFDDQDRPLAIVEKPRAPRSNFAVTGLYFYDNQVLDIAAHLKPSPRGELEITDVNRVYLERSQLAVQRLGRGFAWLDTGTEASLLQAANFVQTIEERQGFKIACLEEIAFRKGFIDAPQLADLAHQFRNSYGQYLRQLLDERPAAPASRRKLAA